MTMTDGSETDSTSQQQCTESDTQDCTHRLNHDVRASLAVVNGFNQILESAFAELCHANQSIREEHPDMIEPEQVKRLEDLESDCRHCLSRVRRSVDQLSARIAAQKLLDSSVGNDRQVSGRNVA